MTLDAEHSFVYLGFCILESRACFDKNLAISIFMLGSYITKREPELETHLKHVSAVVAIASASPIASMSTKKNNGVLEASEKVGDMYLR